MDVADLPGTVTNEPSKKPIKSVFVSVRQRPPKACYVSLTAKTGVRVPLGSANHFNALRRCRVRGAIAARRQRRLASTVNCRQVLDRAFHERGLTVKPSFEATERRPLARS